MKLSTWLTLAAVLALAWASAARATEYYVHADAAPSGNGETWATAFDSLDDITPFTTPALMSGDTIYVAGGTVNSYPGSVTAYSGVKLIGGFAPSGNPPIGSQNSGLYPTIIDGSASISGVGMYVQSGASASTIVDGFVIENSPIFGIHNGNASEAIFDNLILRGNGEGGSSNSGAFLNGGDLAYARIFNSVFENNTGVAGGGAVSNPPTSSFFIEGCVFRGNTAMFGGAISNEASETYCGSPCQPTTPPCESPCDPVIQPIPLLRFCVFESNATDPDFGGNAGAIYSNGDIKVLACSFTTNSARGNGGAIQSLAGRLWLQDVSFVDNTAGGSGGAVHIVKGCEFSAYSCLFARNQAADGGALYAIQMNDTTLQNCTIVENEATSQWPGVYVEVNYDGCGETDPIIADVQNCILWHNGCDDDEVECTNYLNQINIAVGNGGTLTVDYNDIRNLPGSPPAGFGANNIDADPLFVDPLYINYRLKRTSPCLDAGNSEIIPQDDEDADGDSVTGCTGCDETDDGEHIPDLDLRRRIFDAPATDSGLPPIDSCPLECGYVVDMGAYEFTCVDCGVRGDLTGDNLVNGRDIQPFTDCALFQSEAELPCVCADLSGPNAGQPDSKVDIYDVPCFVELLLTGDTSCTGPGNYCDPPTPHDLTDCNDNDIPDANDIAFGTSLDCNANGIPDECDIADETSTDVNENNQPDDCETDCNLNGLPDSWEIAEEMVADINENGIPDPCEPDCDGNDQPDDYDIAHGADDCNENGVIDSCEYDCNNNGVPDDCDIDPLDPDGNEEVSEDCNENGIPDECDLARAFLASFDCNGNDIPDECDIASSTSEDCNENGIPDECDIANSISADENENDIPDECEEESFMFGGGNFMMDGEGGEFDADAAWATFYDWLDQQVFGTPGDWHTLSGPQRFERVMDELRILGLPLAAPW